ncbi:MAG: hypothetical protein RLZZ520_782 [Bacteroidota bacterium]|jgi:hypothetical protein
MEWNKKIKDHLQQLEVAPPEDCWENVSAELQQAKVIPMSSSYSRAITWLKYSAAAVVIGLSVFTFINEPFRNALQNAVLGPGTKAAIIDSTPANRTDSITLNDTAR